jgi:ankyrin repeat protein
MSKKDKEKEKGANAIHEAIRRGELTTVKKLLRKSSTPLNNPVTLQTPLHIAATEGKHDILVYLLEKKKVDIDARDKEQWTPLHCACHSGHLEIVDQLMANGANLNYKTGMHITRACV